VGGVQLNLADENAVRSAYRAIADSVNAKVGAEHLKGVTVQPMAKLDGYELILGSSIDPQFGPVLLFGLGGQLVEVFKDSTLALPPLTTTLARRMMERTRIYTALEGVRGRTPVDLAMLEQILVRFSQLVAEQHWIKELDINPLLASPERSLALDARVVIFGQEVTQDKLPKLAIRPYPTQYVSMWMAKNGTPITIRPIRPEDEPLLEKFHETLSDRSVYLRYLHPMLLSQRVAHERLSRICHGDYDREITLVAEQEVKPGASRFLGASRMSNLHGTDEARFSVLISDQAQGLGIGAELVRRIVEVAKGEKLCRLIAEMTPDNKAMQRICERLGFRMNPTSDGKLMRAELEL
jgi:acetyltransferase